MRLPTKNIHTHNLVLLVLGTTVNCLAVMRRRFLLFCLSCGHFCHFGKCIFVSLKGIRSFCVLLLLFVSQLCSDTFPFAKQVCANGFPSLFRQFSRVFLGIFCRAAFQEIGEGNAKKGQLNGRSGIWTQNSCKLPAPYEDNLYGLIDDGAGDRSLHTEVWQHSDRVGSEVQFRSTWYFWWGIWWELLLRYLFLGFSDFALHQILGAVLQSRFWFPVVQILVLQLEQKRFWPCMFFAMCPIMVIYCLWCAGIVPEQWCACNRLVF